MMAGLPWHQSEWQRLCSYETKGRLPHALLLAGPAAIGKREFARSFANYLLCSSPVNQQPCGICHSCRLFVAGNHPDFVMLELEEGKKAIKVDDIRNFVAAAALTSQIAKRRVAVINPAEAMNQSAANSLLKTLEEPNPENHILLISHVPWELPATIRSRCQQVTFSQPDKASAVDWLMKQQRCNHWEEVLDCVDGAPLKALDFEEKQGLDRYRQEKRRFASLIAGQGNPVEIGMAWSSDETGMISDWIFRWVLDLIRIREGGLGAMRDHEFSDWLKDLIPRLDSAKLFLILDHFVVLQRGLKTRNLNPQIQYEAVALELMEASR